MYTGVRGTNGTVASTTRAEERGTIQIAAAAVGDDHDGDTGSVTA